MLSFVINRVALVDGLEDRGWVNDHYIAKVEGEGTIDVINMIFDASDTRDYVVRNPKVFVRGVDFVDDATDMWTTSSGLKESYETEVDQLVELLKNE